ncbi:MAG TPA: isoprenylcysteine carboxylmethyltransferase family protein [Segetibacter sp.]|jgi:protein-S-isoprenylcysteine O-methyltransferase Ste14
MKKLTLSIVSNILMVFLPLAGKPALIFNPKILIIIAGSVCVWLTQPAFSFAESNEKKQSDKSSVLLILLMSLISGVIPIVDWAYANTDKNNFSWLTITGVVMIISGILFRTWSVRTLGKYFTPTVQIKEEHQLINSGPYKIVRHPSYFAAFLSIAGAAVLLESAAGLVVSLVAMGYAYYVRIGIEEEKLVEHFGARYSAYMQQTKRIIPFVF